MTYFDKESKRYCLGNNHQWWMKKFIDLAASLPFRPGYCAVEIGPGNGYMTKALAHIGYDVVAIDNCRGVLDHIEKKCSGFNVRTIKSDASNLPLPSGSANVVVANSVMEHVERDTEMVKEISRVLAIGGSVICTVPMRYRWVWPFLWPLNYFHDKIIGHLRRYDLDILCQMFSNSGMVIVYEQYSGHLFKVLATLFQMVLNINTLDKWIEEVDARKKFCKYGSSNITVVAKKVL